MTTRPPFHEQLRYERELRGWSQADLAEKVRCDTKTVGRWEGGVSTPRPYHRQLLCDLFGKSAEELGLMRENAGEDVSSSFPREDWGEAPYIVNLYGREEQCAELTHWIDDQHCQIVAILGMGGVGKTAIAAKIATQIKPAFEYVFWRSLQNAFPLEVFLSQCIRFISNQQHLDLPVEIDDQISVLMYYLRDRHCLIVLDNFESVLQPGRRAGHFREGYAMYGRLLQRVGEAQLQSCLLLTSREKPKEIAHLEGKTSPVRSLRLSGLQVEAGRQILHDKRLVGSDAHWLALVERYSGNPLALRLVSESIQAVFEGNIDRFLQEEAIAFGDINDLLDQQFDRLSAQEREMLYWLAIEREPAPLSSLRENFVYPMPVGAHLEALDSLRRRSLVETREPMQFTLQPVIMEYVTMSLVKLAYKEFMAEAPEVWTHFSFCKALAKDYVRDSQARLLLAPLAERLLARLGKQGIEQSARNMLAGQRQKHTQQAGYLAGNILNLLSYIQCDLRGIDCSHLVIRQACLQGVRLPDANFTHARFISSVFSNTFGNILTVACSPREQVLAAGTTAGEIWIYDIHDGVLHFTCQGHTDGVWSLAFSPDGSLLASSGDDHTIRLWESDSGRCLRVLTDHTNRVRAIAFSPDGKTLASGSDDQTVRLWDVESGHCLRTLHGHTDRVWSVAYNLDGRLLASGSTDQAVRVWDIGTGNCLTTLRGHTGWVRSVAFHPETSILASGSDDQTIRLWDIVNGQCLNTLPGHTNRIWSVAFHPAGNLLASSSEDQAIRFWDVSTGQCVMLLQGHQQGVRSIAFASNGQMLVSGGEDQAIRVWDTTNGHCLRAMQGYTSRIWSIAFHPDGRSLASASDDAAIHLWDVKAGQCFKLLHHHGAMAVAFSPSGLILASGGQDQNIHMWDARTGRGLRILHGHTNWVRAVAFTPDGTVLASGSDDQTIRLWDVMTGLNLTALAGHAGRVRTIAFSPDGDLLASGSEDQTIRLWDVKSGVCSSVLKGHAGWIRSVAFSPDGSLLASGSEDQTIRLWDVTTGLCLTVLQSHVNRVRCVAFSPSGDMLASSSDDGTIKIWDLRVCVKTLASERPYERMNISYSQGMTEAQKANLCALGAIEENERKL